MSKEKYREEGIEKEEVEEGKNRKEEEKEITRIIRKYKERGGEMEVRWGWDITLHKNATATAALIVALFHFEILASIISVCASCTALLLLVHAADLTDNVVESLVNLDSVFRWCFCERTAKALCQVTTLC